MMERIWTASLLAALCITALAWIVALSREHGFHPARWLAAELRNRPVWETAFLAVIVMGFIHHGATKGTNGVDMGGAPVVGCGLSVPSAQLGVESFLPSRDLEPSTLNLQPSTNLDWLAFGGYMDWFRIPEGDWCFRLGSNLAERLTVFASGEVRTTPHDVSNRISVLGLPLSIVPAANWHLLPQHPNTPTSQHSLFWHSVTPSNSLVLTWRNALVNRDTNLPVTVQAELFPDGAAAVQYGFSGLADTSILSNAAVRIWRDGTVDEVPLLTGTVTAVSLPAPPVTDTNALDEVHARIAGGDSNAYYFAEAVVGKGPARIWVSPAALNPQPPTLNPFIDGYRLMAEPGVTNRLPLLIGPRYAVSSEVAFSHFALVPPELQTVESHPSATNLTDRLVEVRWPVTFGLDEVSASPSETVYALHVTPDFLCGTVSWSGAATNEPMRGAPPLRSGGDGCTCGCQSYSTNTVSHALSCICGECSASGDYGYEGHMEHFEIPFPDTNGGDPPDPPNPGGDPDPPPDPTSSVSVTAEKSIVFFEDAYENGPGESVPRRSTFCKIECNYTAAEAGTLSFSIHSGASRIILHEGSSGGAVTTGGTWPFQQGNSGTKIFYAEGTAASGSIEDVCFKAVFTPDDGDSQPCEDIRSITVVKMTVTANANYPSRYEHRHVFGVCESGWYEAEPSTAPISWNLSENAIWQNMQSGRRLCCMPNLADPVTVTVSGGGETFDINVLCLVPSGINARLFAPKSVSGEKEQAGDIGMLLDFTLMPTNVSFAGFRVSERPSEHGTHTGYFSDPLWSNKWYHTVENGAGIWNTVDTESNHYALDEAYISYCEAPWSAGTLSWEVPNAWLPSTNYTPVLSERTFLTAQQVFTITSDGTVTVTKHGNYATRTTNDNITVNGVIVK